jgi:hypothetical protein
MWRKGIATVACKVKNAVDHLRDYETLSISVFGLWDKKIIASFRISFHA